MQRTKIKNICYILLIFVISMYMAGCRQKETEQLTQKLQETVTEDTEKLPEEEVTQPQTVYVYVCGAVNTPGVYELDSTSRIYEAVQMAGDMTEDAEQTYLNLAQIVSDGERIYVPTKEEVKSGVVEDQGEWTDSGISAEGKVNLNTATKEELMTLTGIGDAKAQAIITFRESNGGFSSIEEIMQIEGIKEGVFNKIKDAVTV